MPGSTVDPYLSYGGEYDVLGGNARGKRAVDVDGQRLCLSLQQALCREYM